VAGSAIVQLIFSMAGREPSDESLAAVIKWSRYRRVPAHPEGASVNPNQPKAYRRRSRCRRHPDQRPQREQHGRRPVDLPDRTAARIGWDVPAQSITIDTRWSVPRYTPAWRPRPTCSTGNSSRLSRTVPSCRPATRRRFSRVEGQFRKLVRHGDNPRNYCGRRVAGHRVRVARS
jgi:hypothetical protein